MPHLHLIVQQTSQNWTSNLFSEKMSPAVYTKHSSQISTELSISSSSDLCLNGTFSVRSTLTIQSVQSLSHVQLLNHSIPGLPVHHQLPEFTQTHVHWVSDAIQTSHPLSSPYRAFNLSQHRGLFQWVSSSLQVAREVLEFQLQHQFFQWTLRTDLL